ncbi:GrdX family protein [Peptostreptococcus sp. D1]|uniref:GrdX family protein n=1 Tax=Peptostreptococcus sp. D1 TaxID=72304 RepID=UPI0008F14D51|nr:GrdX family protein [Peptostreptococcus sp. D1]SFE15023.1 hypothetical protein SAMN02910278_00037 [Peptostreptococcus sp. D1]
MDFTIVTNNTIVKDNYENIIFVEGDFFDVLLEVRSCIHLGHELISYPLGASIRMMYSPIRSILIGKELKAIDENSIEVIENSIEKYKVTMGERNVDERNRRDYEVIDYELIKSAIYENDFINEIL